MPKGASFSDYRRKIPVGLHFLFDKMYCNVGNQQYGIHKYTVFFYHIVMVYIRNDHNMVKKYCILIYTI